MPKQPKRKYQISKTTVAFPHPVPASLIERYLSKSMPFHAAIESVEVRFASLSQEEYDVLYDACMEECYPSRQPRARTRSSLGLDQLKLGFGGAK